MRHPVDGGTSAAERLAEELRAELLSGRYAPGQRLKEEELAARFGTGRYTVRTALRIVAQSRLLEHRANRGATVPQLTRQRVDEVSDYRQVLEVGALRLALARRADLDGIVEATRALQELDDEARWVDVVLRHQQIHREVVVAAGNAPILQAYSLCEDELRYIVSTVRPDYTASRLTMLHLDLLAGLHRGGATAIRALERDLLVGRCAVVDALVPVKEEHGTALPVRARA